MPADADAGTNTAAGPYGARARDHLANERTYLAWLRTAINVMVLGLVVAKFVHSAGSRAEIAGAILVAVGFLLLVYGTARTRLVSTELEAGHYTLDDRAVLMVSAVVAVAVVASVILLFA